MDPAGYTLIGALGGVAIAQLANYLLEERRMKHRREDEKVGHRRSLANDLRGRRQVAYSLFMAELDYWYAFHKEDRLDHLLQHFYSACVISSPDIMEKLGPVLRIARNHEISDEQMRELKHDLLELMRADLTRLDADDI